MTERKDLVIPCSSQEKKADNFLAGKKGATIGEQMKRRDKNKKSERS